MPPIRNIFLIGPMGSGKSAVGRHLARLFRFNFLDSDADIESKTGVDISFIFEKEGEAGFRVRERESIERLTQLESIVLATGGGGLCLFTAIARLRAVHARIAPALEEAGIPLLAQHVDPMDNATLVLSFTGWMDGGNVSTGTVERLVDLLSARQIAEIDPEPFYIYDHNIPIQNPEEEHD